MSGPLVVLGDALLDADVRGRAERLAPDAPVPVVQVEEESERPGGAGLAAALARRGTTGREVVLVAPVAGDPEGERLRALLDAAGVTVAALPHHGRTTVKRRVLAQDGRPLVRLDSGGPVAEPRLSGVAEEALRAADAVLVSDYGLGSTAAGDVRALLSDVRGRVVWDPHPRGGAPVAGIDLVTPNQSEAATFDGEPAGGDLGAVADRAARLVSRWQARAVAVTLGSHGALLSRGDDPPLLVPAPAGDLAGRDTCGAGDAFAASAALALAGGALTSEAVEAAVAEASRFVAAGGAANFARGPETGKEPRRPDDETPDPTDAPAVVKRVAAAGGTVVATGGCFDLLHAGHVETLRAARALGDCLVVLLNSDASVRRLKGPSRPIVPEADRARVLMALDAVDAVVVFDDDTPVPALRRLRPRIWCKGGDYSEAQLPEAPVVREWGGRTVVLPYLDGRSTTRLVAASGARSG